MTEMDLTIAANALRDALSGLNLLGFRTQALSNAGVARAKAAFIGFPFSDLGVTNIVDNPAPNIGDQISFTVTASNNGPNNAANVTVTDILPVGLTFVSATPSVGAYNASTGIWTIGGLAANTFPTLTISATVASLNPATNTATISGQVSDSNPANNSASATETPVCYLSGTLIRTVRGAVPVETLQVGDLAVTASGEHRPIRWLGHRTSDCRSHSAPRNVWPVRIAKHAFGTHKPERDLFVSPGHAICVDVAGAILIPASSLVNGSTITQVEVDTVTYWHVELDSHDVLLAEGLPAESYLDTGNRAFFAANGVADPDAATHTRADGCHPLHHRGPLVDAVRMRLAARAMALGWTPNRDADLHLVVDGTVVRPFAADGSAVFLFPASARDVRLVSNTFVPADCGGTDTRRLGVRIHGLSLSGTHGTPRRIDLDDPALVEHTHASERRNSRAWRWTQGDLALSPALWSGLSGHVTLHLTYAAATVRGYQRPAELALNAPARTAELDAAA